MFRHKSQGSNILRRKALDNIIALNVNRDVQNTSFLQKIDELSNQSSPTKLRKSKHSPQIGDGLKILNDTRKSLDMKENTTIIQPKVAPRKSKGMNTVKIDQKLKQKLDSNYKTSVITKKTMQNIKMNIKINNSKHTSLTSTRNVNFSNQKPSKNTHSKEPT